MKPAFLILPLAVALCACAQTVTVADACKPAAVTPAQAGPSRCSAPA